MVLTFLAKLYNSASGVYGEVILLIYLFFTAAFVGFYTCEIVKLVRL